MSDATQGPGWWQAADGKWYAPEQHPDFTSPTQPVESVAPTEAVSSVPPPPVPPPDATQAMPPLAPPMPPGPPLPGPAPVPGGPPPGGSNRGKLIAIVAVIAAIVIVAALLLLNRDSGDNNKVAATDSSKSDQSNSTDATDVSDATTTTKKKTTTTAKTTTTKPTTTTGSNGPTDAQLTKLLLPASEMGTGLKEAPFTPDSKNPEACGQPNTDIGFPPTALVGRAAQASQQAVLEQIRAYADPATSAKAFDTNVQGVSCPNGNAFDSSGKPVPITIGPVQDITAQVKGAVRAIAVTVKGSDFEGLAIGVDVGGGIVAFEFESAAGAGTETLDARLPVAQAGVDKVLAG